MGLQITGTVLGKLVHGCWLQEERNGNKPLRTHQPNKNNYSHCTIGECSTHHHRNQDKLVQWPLTLATTDLAIFLVSHSKEVTAHLGREAEVSHKAHRSTAAHQI